jgi:hypothetical protein
MVAYSFRALLSILSIQIVIVYRILASAFDHFSSLAISQYPQSSISSIIFKLSSRSLTLIGRGTAFSGVCVVLLLKGGVVPVPKPLNGCTTW